MPLPQPDLGVLRKAQRGDERAFSIIVRTYEQPVYNYVLRLTGDRSLSEDLTQEVFLRVFQGLPSFSLRSRFTTWLFQVTKNRVLDELRAIERRPRSVVNIEDVPPLEVVDAPAERAETIDAVWRAIEDLNPDLKMALLLRDIVGLSYTEIAETLEVTLATVKWRIYKAREEVQLALHRDGVVVPITRHRRPRAGSPRRLRWARDAPVCPGSRRTARRRAHGARRLSRHARAARRLRARRLCDERRAEARRSAEATSARDRGRDRGARRRRRVGGACRGRRSRIREPLAAGRLARGRRATDRRGGRGVRLRLGCRAAADPGGDGVRESDGARHGRHGEERRVRRLRSRGCWRSPATTSSASTTTTTPARRWSASTPRSRRCGAVRSHPRTATRASTSPSWRRFPAIPCRPCSSGSRRRSSASASISTRGSCRARSRPRSRRRSRCSTRSRKRALSGHARARTATTRIACSSAPAASRRTSRPMRPTSAGSTRADSTA